MFLDSETSGQVMELLQRTLKDLGQTMVMITHNASDDSLIVAIKLRPAVNTKDNSSAVSAIAITITRLRLLWEDSCCVANSLRICFCLFLQNINYHSFISFPSFICNILSASAATASLCVIITTDHYEKIVQMENVEWADLVLSCSSSSLKNDEFTGIQTELLAPDEGYYCHNKIMPVSGTYPQDSNERIQKIIIMPCLHIICPYLLPNLLQFGIYITF